MNLIDKIMGFIRNLFYKKEKVKEIEAPKQVIKNNGRENFIDSLKFTTTKKIKEKNIETQIRSGDGLGIKDMMQD